MITHDRLNEIIENYMSTCRGGPSKRGLARALGISNTTIFNVIRGYYNHVPYSLEPGPTRIIDTGDFELIRGIFKADSDNWPNPYE